MIETMSLVYINRYKEILMVQLAEGVWTLPGGKKEEKDSSLLQGLIRELSEELPELTFIPEKTEPDFSVR